MTGSDQLASAEAILEDLGSRIPPLADFGSIPFTNLTANGVPPASAGAVNDTAVERKTTPLTTDSPLSGGQFTINWLHS